MERERFLRFLTLGVAEDEIDWTAHDRRYYGGNYDEKTMTCKARAALETGDLADVLTAEREEADYKKLSQKLEKERVKHETAERIERKTIAELTSRDYTDEDWKMVDDAMRHVMTAKPVEVTMQEANKLMCQLRGNKPKDVVANMIRYFEQTYPDGIEVPDIGKVEVNRASAKSIFAHATGGVKVPKIAAICQLRDILRNGSLFCVHSKWKGRSYDSLNYVSPMLLGSKEKIVEFTIIKHPEGKQELYNIKVLPKEIVEDAISHLIASQGGREQNTSSTTPHSLPNSALPVNRCGKENSGLPKLPSSKLVRQYLATHGLFVAYLPQMPTQDAFQFDEKAFKTYLSLQGYSR